jgi:hypothetical protein
MDHHARRYSTLCNLCCCASQQRVEKFLNEEKVDLLFQEGDVFRSVIAWNKVDILQTLLKHYKEGEVAEDQEDWVNKVWKSKLIFTLKHIYKEVDFSEEVRLLLEDFAPFSSVYSICEEIPEAIYPGVHPETNTSIDILQTVLSLAAPNLEEIIWDYLGFPLTEEACCECQQMDCLVCSDRLCWCLDCGYTFVLQ